VRADEKLTAFLEPDTGDSVSKIKYRDAQVQSRLKLRIDRRTAYESPVSIKDHTRLLRLRKLRGNDAQQLA